MKNINLTDILVYPVKSTTGFYLEEVEVENKGLPFDRNFGIIGHDDKIITARENPKLLNIATKLQNNILELSSFGKASIQLSLDNLPQMKSLRVGIFSDFTRAIPVEHEVNNWISTVLQQPAKLVKTDPITPRKIKDKYHPQAEEIISFCDAAPIHLISEASLADLNSQLAQPVMVPRFRPNLVIKGAEAWVEDHWRQIEIGECIFEVVAKTARCSFLTIHPQTTERNKNQEPLRTLSKIKKSTNEVTFGIYLIPRKLGLIKKGDHVTVLAD